MTILPSNTPILEMKNISKRFGAVQALRNVTFDLYPGEVVGLVGDNGAGKSTLVKVIAGIFQADSGEIRYGGVPVNIRNPKDAVHLGIQTVYQDLSLCDNIDVVGNMYLGKEMSRGEMLDETGMEKRAIEVLKSLAVTLPSVRNIVATLSSGQRQTVAIARTLIGDARIIILDEPTAALGVNQSRQVLDLIKKLSQQGLAVIVISHNLAHIFEVVDRIVVLYLGMNNGVFIKDASRDKVASAIAGADFDRMTETIQKTYLTEKSIHEKFA